MGAARAFAVPSGGKPVAPTRPGAARSYHPSKPAIGRVTNTPPRDRRPGGPHGPGRSAIGPLDHLLAIRANKDRMVVGLSALAERPQIAEWPRPFVPPVVPVQEPGSRPVPRPCQADRLRGTRDLRPGRSQPSFGASPRSRGLQEPRPDPFLRFVRILRKPSLPEAPPATALIDHIADRPAHGRTAVAASRSRATMTSHRAVTAVRGKAPLDRRARSSPFQEPVVRRSGARRSRTSPRDGPLPGRVRRRDGRLNALTPNRVVAHGRSGPALLLPGGVGGARPGAGWSSGAPPVPQTRRHQRACRSAEQLRGEFAQVVTPVDSGVAAAADLDLADPPLSSTPASLRAARQRSLSPTQISSRLTAPLNLSAAARNASFRFSHSSGVPPKRPALQTPR